MNKLHFAAFVVCVIGFACFLWLDFFAHGTYSKEFDMDNQCWAKSTDLYVENPETSEINILEGDCAGKKLIRSKLIKKRILV